MIFEIINKYKLIIIIAHFFINLYDNLFINNMNTYFVN